MTALPFDVVSALTGLAAGLGFGTLLARRWFRGERRPPDELWQALQKEPPVGGDTAASWAEALTQTQRLHEAALRSHHLHLRTLAAEQRLQRTELVLANLQDGLLVVDADERVLYGNRTARTVLQLGDRDPVTLAEAGAPFAVVDAVRSVLAADLGRTVKTSRIEVEHGGERHVYLIRAVAESEASGTRAQVVALEDWTAEERQARSKSEFIYSVSHELKTPLTAIQASLELANDGDDLDPSDRDKLIRVSYDESVRLSTMVQEL
ncbi:MAG: PAS domain-containing protein, partial [Planctomycetes bacterium]|nr:PAS domain-containing protein [Planctomycetota bacterium]